MGDSVLTSPVLNWGPIFSRIVTELLEGTYADAQEVWDGAPEGGVELAPYSPRVAAATRALVESEHAQMRAGSDRIFCGPLVRRWTISGTGCGAQPIWEQLDPPQPVALSLYVDENGAALPSDLSEARPADCLSDATLLGSSQDFLLDGGAACEI